MTWDPAVTQTLVVMGIIIAVVAVLVVTKKSGQVPGGPPEEVTFSRATWGHVLKDGEEIEAQAPALQPTSWIERQIFTASPTRWSTPRQLALTSRGALLFAEQKPGDLGGRRRYELGTFRIERVRKQDPYCVSLCLRASRKVVRLERVPQSFLERLRSRGVDVSASSSV